MFINPVIGMAAGTQVRAGQPLVAEGRAIGAASHRDNDRRNPDLGHGCLGVFDQVQMVLDHIEHASSRISETGSGFKEFVSMASAEKRKWADLGSLINKSVALCRGQNKKTVRHFELKIADDLPPIFTDPSALEQVLVNLLINAAQAVDGEDSWVMLSATLGNTLQDHLIIEVSDNGCGMDEEKREKIFDPFYTTKEDMKGSGLGLFVSKNLIEDLGGLIEVDSKVGKGSTVRITLPR